MKNLNNLNSLYHESWNEVNLIKVICFNVNNEGQYPFIQIMLQNFNNILSIPIFYKLLVNNTDFLEYILIQIKNKL